MQFEFMVNLSHFKGYAQLVFLQFLVAKWHKVCLLMNMYQP